MLQISNLSKSYPQRGLVLNRLELSVSEGDSISISGPSGSGKTTLLNILGLLDRPDAGEILFRGKSILAFNSEESASYRNRNIGFVFQDHLLLPYLTVKENILLPLIPSRLNKDEYLEKVDYANKLMEDTGISNLTDKYPFRISGGEAQRVALVRALINKPSLLLADEPTGSLDKTNSENLGNILLKMNREHSITMIIATHSANLAEKMSMRLSLSEGVLVRDVHN
jgi:ABC-type lipoprotein export system ATPase subunit